MPTGQVEWHFAHHQAAAAINARWPKPKFVGTAARHRHVAAVRNRIDLHGDAAAQTR